MEKDRPPVEDLPVDDPQGDFRTRLRWGVVFWLILSITHLFHIPI